MAETRESAIAEAPNVGLVMLRGELSGKMKIGGCETDHLPVHYVYPECVMQLNGNLSWPRERTDSEADA